MERQAMFPKIKKILYAPEWEQVPRTCSATP